MSVSLCKLSSNQSAPARFSGQLRECVGQGFGVKPLISQNCWSRHLAEEDSGRLVALPARDWQLFLFLCSGTEHVAMKSFSY
jgi:hypothetical protein